MRLFRRIKKWLSSRRPVGVYEERDYVVVFCGDFSMILPAKDPVVAEGKRDAGKESRPQADRDNRDP